MPTILDVARSAGVSMKTVSRVMNGEAHVRSSTRARVEEAVDRLGYRPNLAARQLAGHRSFLIAYPFNNPSAAYTTNVMMGAARACRDRGYHLVSEPVELDDSATATIERLIATLRPDGIILTPPLSDMASIIEHIAGFSVPIVRIAGSGCEADDAFAIDESSIAEAMTRHLLECGHRRIGFIMPHPDHGLAQGRYEGYVRALGVRGISPDPALVQPGLFDVESGKRAANTLLDLPDSPTAIFAANDDMALGALQIVLSRGLRVPGDVAIAGFDDSPASALTWPPLTTVRQPIQALGAEAVALLLDGSVDASALHHELIIRASTDASAGLD